MSSLSKKQAVAASYARKAGLVVSKPAVRGRGSYHARTTVSHAAKPRKIRGRGDYKKDYGSRLGSVIGEGLQELLTQLGGIAGIGRAVAGVGDYVRAPWEIKSNSLMSMGNDPPEIINSKSGGVIVRHREYLKDIVTSPTAGEFQVEQFPIQPGNYETFPWLYQIAQNFEQYQLRGMIFEFKSTSADALNSVNTALGTVVMATEYDSSKPGFVNKSQMENHQYGMSAKQSCSMLHPIECAAHQSTLETLYVRTASESSPDTDIRMYDFGNFSIATVGQQGTSVNIGELWVTYEIELLKPQLRSAGGDALSSWFVFAGSITSLLPFGDLSSIQANDSNDLDVYFDQTQYPSGALLFPDTVPSGTYLLAYSWALSSAEVVNAPTWKSVDDVTTTIGGEWSPIPGGGGQFAAPAGGETASRVQNGVILHLGPPVQGRRRGIYILSSATYGTTASGGAVSITTIEQKMGQDYSTWPNNPVSITVEELNPTLSAFSSLYGNSGESLKLPPTSEVKSDCSPPVVVTKADLDRLVREALLNGNRKVQ